MIADLFKQARETLTIPQAWQMLGLQGEPKASCKSPWRDERTPSFSIYDDGTKWKDHGEQIGGDVIEFIRITLGTDHTGVREWLQSHIGTIESPQSTAKASAPPKVIQYPSPFIKGTGKHWRAMSSAKGIDPFTAKFMDTFDMLKFMRIEGASCYVVTDEQNINAEIRRLDGSLFPNGKKAFPLAGVDKSWLIGASILEQSPCANVLLVEGATDYLTAWDIVLTYTRDKVNRTVPWIPVALLGAGCKALHSGCAKLLAGRHVRLVPDGDDAGDRMRDHWTAILPAIGCSVDAVIMPRGKDLTDIKSELQPQDLFTL